MSKPVLVISAHLDDAVLSCGQFIEGRKGNVDVLTVFSGIPMQKDLLTEYDKACGFTSSKDAVVVRREEDREACAILNAHPIYTEHLDRQYIKRPDFDWVDSIKKLITNNSYEMIIGPLGLRHPDHIDIANNLKMLDLENLYFYEDLPHRVTHPEEVFMRLDHMGLFWGSPTQKTVFVGDGSITEKLRALWCYKSQMGRGDLNIHNICVSERFWRVA